MKVCELVSNQEFTFNLPFRILSYDFDTDESTLLYEAKNEPEEGDIPYDLMFSSISAINMGDDGVIEIEII